MILYYFSVWFSAENIGLTIGLLVGGVFLTGIVLCCCWNIMDGRKNSNHRNQGLAIGQDHGGQNSITTSYSNNETMSNNSNPLHQTELIRVIDMEGLQVQDLHLKLKLTSLLVLQATETSSPTPVSMLILV